MLVKLNLNEEQVAKLEKLKYLTNEKAGSKAALFALDNYHQLDIDHYKLQERYDDLKNQLETIREAYRNRLEADKVLSAFLMS